MKAKIHIYKNGKLVAKLSRENFHYGKSVARRWSDIDPGKNEAIVKVGKQKHRFSSE